MLNFLDLHEGLEGGYRSESIITFFFKSISKEKTTN